MEPILQTKKLNLRYGAFQALYGIDTDIFPNEITALIGPSGCGKSTYLKTLNRMNDLVPGCKKVVNPSVSLTADSSPVRGAKSVEKLTCLP